MTNIPDETYNMALRRENRSLRDRVEQMERFLLFLSNNEKNITDKTLAKIRTTQSAISFDIYQAQLEITH
jgi:hypothetical protein